jgi:hypothetical protein
VTFATGACWVSVAGTDSAALHLYGTGYECDVVPAIRQWKRHGLNQYRRGATFKHNPFVCWCYGQHRIRTVWDVLLVRFYQVETQ